MNLGATFTDTRFVDVIFNSNNLGEEIAVTGTYSDGTTFTGVIDTMEELGDGVISYRFKNVRPVPKKEQIDWKERLSR